MWRPTRKKKWAESVTLVEKTFSKHDLARHRFRHLSEDEKVALVKQGSGRECLFCQKKFPDNHTYHKHLVSHTKEKPFPCDQCEKQFSLKSNLTMHKRSHTSNPKTVKCDECGLQSKTSSDQTQDDGSPEAEGLRVSRVRQEVWEEESRGATREQCSCQNPAPLPPPLWEDEKGHLGKHVKKIHPPE
ncbi:zinc finger protein 91 [Folsomia candida]|nr:zinc finger protein 91 [Folsomia candida]